MKNTKARINSGLLLRVPILEIKKMIRRINQNDREFFLEQSAAFYASDAVLHDVPKENHVKAFDELMNENSLQLGFIIEYMGERAGYLLLSKKYSREAGGMELWIEELLVRSEYRGKGLGREALEYVISGKAGACERIRLEVEPENETAYELYIRLGFEPLEYTQLAYTAK